ncbi:metal ABC transporter solute-binding protein, Zn/Mn family [Jeotgalibacillus marinus]|uniref:Zinc ABC transporter substrate-binding protein n=1 Tax=Jeotgalibacillus marinus TaxID=86667 RepID=A0ABV3Q684_9BACL
MKKTVYAMLLASFVWVLTACNTDNPSVEKDSDSLEVYTTVYPLQDFAEKIGREYVNVETIYPPGADEHTFEPSQQDMIKLAEADLFFYIGLGLEGFVDRAIDVLESQDLVMKAAADSITDGQLEGNNDDDEEEDSESGHEGHDHGDVDPHVWLDPVLSQSLALSIKNSLIEAMPNQEAYFTENYEELVAQLDELDHEFKNLAEEAQVNQLFVSHAAYSYWESRYGFEQLAIAGISTSEEPSQRELTSLIKIAKDNNIKHILFEQNVSSNLTEVIQKEIGADALELHNLSVLTPEDIDNNNDYFSLMEQNIETLKTALQVNELH